MILSIPSDPPMHPARIPFQAQGVCFTTFHDNPHRLAFGYSGALALFPASCIHDPDRHWIVLNFILPLKVPPAFRREAALLANLLNNALPGAGFCVDPDDGGLTLRHLLHLNDGAIAAQPLRAALLFLHSELDFAYPLFLDLALGRASQLEAIARRSADPGRN